ncbi:DUF3164 family protein [Endothiovibrio diazotrophicus]
MANQRPNPGYRHGTMAEIDDEMHDVVTTAFAAAEPIHAALKRFYDAAMQKVDELVANTSERYGKRVGGESGDVTLYTRGRGLKMTVRTNYREVAGHQADVAKKKLDEAIRRHGGNVPAVLKGLAESTFSPGRGGNISVSGVRRILTELRKHVPTEKRDETTGDAREINDLYRAAIAAAEESITTVASKRFVRLERRDEAGEYRALHLDLAEIIEEKPVEGGDA